MNAETKNKLIGVLKADPDYSPEMISQFLKAGEELAGRVPFFGSGDRIVSRVQAANALRVSTAAVDIYAKRGWLVRVYFPGAKRARGFTESSVMAMKRGNRNIVPGGCL